ncbi:NPC1-like intracellular cholesterol transporter 1 isoform X2 [Eublepharis macularius]|uniref:NPC1-like intracellular cholesterol transporter 1 isoform X2 n=1 Tax=Eublepharis macularius TaxID=481883 RepID=A0AA97LFW2_EUBMA|nr:NPC1-like intracellular cholesterol transporter 1 isoform X2 [Eublepharis macularius]
MLGTFLVALLLSRVMPGLTAAPTNIHRAGYCAFYDTCGLNPEISSSILPATVPCVSNMKAPQLSGKHLELLKTVCPMLHKGDSATFACCSIEQLQAVKLSLDASQGILSRCPSCAENLANIHCQNVCSPDQSLFTNVTRVFSTTINGTQREGVLEYQCYYNQRFADRSFNSCKSVRLPSTGGYAIGAMCGKYGATLCNAQRWLDFQGDSSNGLAPLEILFQLMPDGSIVGDDIVPFNGTAWKCSEPVRGSGDKCSCPDCPDSCPHIPSPTPAPEPFRVGRIDGVLFVCMLLFGLLTLLFVSCLMWRSCSSTKKPKDPALKMARKRLTCSEKFSWAIHNFLTRTFRSLGVLVASYPITVIAISAGLVISLSCGIIFIRLTTDPVELWSSPNSQARQEKDFYDQNFGPFFRTNQVILTVKDRSNYTYDSLILGKKNFNGILSMDVLLQLLTLQTKLQNIEVWSEKHGKNISLQDVCYAPLNPQNASLSDCCVNSLLQYFQNNRTHLEMEANQTVRGETGKVDWRDHFLYCTNSPLSFQDITELKLSCMADYGAPVFPFLAVGGYPGEEYSEAQALILTFSLNNYPRNDPNFDKVMLWEKRFLEIVQEFQQEHADNYSIAYMTERSLEDEINRTTLEDLPIFAVSYLLIFVYIALALGEYHSCRHLLVDSKMTLGLGGILVVLGGVMSSVGFYSYVGLPSSLIIIEVVPFLVLAVGADNIFIFVLEYQQSEQQPGESREQHIGRVLGDVAPSMLLCSVSEAICFLLGALSEMPAVHTFALNAALAVLFDFLLQITMFVALVSLDARRHKASRFDLCCCVRLEKRGQVKKHESLLRSFTRRFYVPVLLNSIVRILVVVFFIFMFCAGIFLMFNVQVGLDQELSVPKDSYMLKYFQYLNQYFMVGAPTYFVTTGGYNFSSIDGMNGVCSSTGCDNNSMTQKIQHATQFPKESFLAIPASSWVDDFIDWLNPMTSCCRIHRSGEKEGQFCSSTETDQSCLLNMCMKHTSDILRPDVEQFNKFLPWFLNDIPNLKCPKGGRGAYDTSVRFGSDGEIQASRFMAYHIPLKSSQDYTAALKAARELSDNITASMRKVPGTDPTFRVFPYTITYVFFEQYMTIAVAGITNMVLCLVPTFIVCYVLLGMDLRSGFINLLTIIMIVVDTVGAMTLWGISYNAISLINLVTVFAGVAMTNLPGIVVLAFAKAQLIQIFFFRLNLIITLLGMLHGLVFLPVILSYFGPNASQAWVPAQQQTEGNLALSNPTFEGKENQANESHCQPLETGSDPKEIHEEGKGPNIKNRRVWTAPTQEESAPRTALSVDTGKDIRQSSTLEDSHISRTGPA